MTVKGAKFIVVENAGMIGETDLLSFDNWQDAKKYIDDHYDADERDQFHPDYLSPEIRQDWIDEDGELRQEYI